MKYKILVLWVLFEKFPHSKMISYDFYFAFLCHKKDLVVIFLEMEVTAREKKNFN